MMMATKMTEVPCSHAIIHHHGDTSHEDQRTSPAKRSRSIKIKRSRRSDDFDSSSMSTCMQMYDLAMWRMYQRITSARRAKYAVMPRMDVHSSVPLSTSSSSFSQEAMRNYATHDDFAATDDGSDEGVFVMDLWEANYQVPKGFIHISHKLCPVLNTLKKMMLGRQKSQQKIDMHSACSKLS